MDVRDWPLDQIMQLPDCCFGRRWPIYLYAHVTGIGQTFYLSPIALPEITVIWEIAGQIAKVDPDLDWWAVRLGDKLPTTLGEFRTYEKLWPDLGWRGAAAGHVAAPYSGDIHINRLKAPIRSAGRRFVLAVDATAEDHAMFMIWIVVSSIPREVPDCLISEYLRSR